MAGSVWRIVVLTRHRIRALQGRCWLWDIAGIVVDATESLYKHQRKNLDIASRKG
jgi:hypothetical protein